MTTTDAQFVIEKFVLVPLTPIHVGGGDEAAIYPDEYRIRDDRIELVSARAILVGMGAQEREGWLRDMGRAQQDALERLLDKAPDEAVTGRIKISEASRRELGAGRRRGDFGAFQRAGGRAVLPGSSLKGTLRTAWLAVLAKKLGLKAQNYKHLEQEAFKLAGGSNVTDTDPFRDVLVRDAPLPDGATLVDKVDDWKKSGRGYGLQDNGQLHKERLRAVVDGGEPPLIEVEIGLRGKGLRALRDRFDPHHDKTPSGTPPRTSYLLRALEAHHAPLWQHEVDEKFFAGDHGTRLRAALGLFAQLCRTADDPDAALIRIGWAGHAEAKSVEGLRRIEIRNQRERRTRIATEGTTRHVVSLAGNPAPFGWALLVRSDRWKAPAEWLPRPVARAIPGAAGHAPTPTRALARLVKWPKGTRVGLTDGEEAILDEDVTEATRGEVWVLIEGDREPVDVSEIEGKA